MCYLFLSYQFKSEVGVCVPQPQSPQKYEEFSFLLILKWHVSFSTKWRTWCQPYTAAETNLLVFKLLLSCDDLIALAGRCS